MKNKLNKKAAVFTIFSMLILVAFVPVLNSSTIKNNTLQNDTMTYDIYFGTISPPPKVMSNQTETSYDPEILEYNTTYYWQIIAWNDQGESAEGPIWSFTTETISPSVETLYADQIGKNNATLHGKILEDGGEQCQICFRYRESGETNWTYPSDWHGSFSTNDTFSEEIDGLNKTTLYEFQAGAKNSIGETWGEIKNFTTATNQLPVAIIVAPNSADKKTDIIFDGTNSYDPDGFIVGYLWDFGDGGTGSGSMVTHQFQISGTYIVTLQVVDNDGDIGVVTHQITINNNAPIAVIVVDQQYIQPGDTVTFDGTGSYDPNGDSLTYEWKLGDGTVIGTDAIITYTFTTSGNFMVILTVTDDDPVNPMSDSTTVMIYVNAPPIADVGFDFLTIPFGIPWTFDGSNSVDPDGIIVNYTWDFGNGDVGYGMIIAYTYYMSGTFLVTLTVEDDYGATDDDSGVITVMPVLIDYPTHNEYRVTKMTHKTASSISTISMINSPVKKPLQLLYPPRPPSNPYPEDGAVNVPVDVVLSWTSGEDSPPVTPVISGETNGKVGEEYTYCINPVVDPDGDRVWVFWDWDDGTNTSWLGPYESGEQACANHTWDEKGTYTIKARLRDDYDVLSDWGYLEVTMPRSKTLDNAFLQRLLEKFHNAFPILRYFIRL